MAARMYGEISRAMVVDAIHGAELILSEAVWQKLIDTGFMTADADGACSWSRQKLGDLTTDTLVDLYVSLKSTETPRVLP